MEKIKEKLLTKVMGEYDVLVVGGGIAGVSSALSLSRQNKKVCLIEREFALGGLATLGLIAIYLPLCDGLGHQVSFGIAEELLKLSVKNFGDKGRGYNEWILNFQKVKTPSSPRYEVNFNPAMFALEMEKLLKDNGVNILFGTTAVGVRTKKDKITSVIFENKSGRFAFNCKGVIDCTGDADIASLCKIQTALPLKNNTLAGWYQYVKNGEFRLKTLGYCDSTESYKKDKENDIKTDLRFSGIDGNDVSNFTKCSHDLVYSDVLKLKKNDESFVLTNFSAIPQMRMTRRIVGEYTMTEKDMGKELFDSIGKVSDWKTSGKVYEVPLSSLYNKKIKNLGFAGRCVSTDDNMWDVMRVIPCCAVTGEGVATAMACSYDLTKVDIKAVQSVLIKNGVVIH